jgi:aspartate carbamoyltransferase catalytic subunit
MRSDYIVIHSASGTAHVKNLKSSVINAGDETRHPTQALLISLQLKEKRID